MRNLVFSVLTLTLSGAAAMAQLPAPAADTVVANRPQHLGAATLDALERALAEEGRSVPRPTKELLNVSTHRISMIHRSKTDAAEMHPDRTDVWIIKSGSGTVIIGGEMVNRRPAMTTTVFAESITGGERYAARPGDIFNIPPDLPHQMLVEPGETVTYYNLWVRTDRLPLAR